LSVFPQVRDVDPVPADVFSTGGVRSLLVMVAGEDLKLVPLGLGPQTGTASAI
jgi:hypothetical protein